MVLIIRLIRDESRSCETKLKRKMMDPYVVESIPDSDRDRSIVSLQLLIAELQLSSEIDSTHAAPKHLPVQVIS